MINLRVVLLAVAALAALVVLAGCAPATDALTDRAARASTAPASAAGDLAAVQVAPDGPSAGYSRAAFNAVGWPPGPDGCSVRDETLARDLSPTGRTNHGRCDIVAGTLADPYSGATVTGPTRTDEIDHVVPLALAWRSGAARWTAAQRAAFAVDPAELQTTTHTQNDAKGDKGPEAWAPPSRGDWCRYAHTFTGIAVKYRLTVTQARHDALARMEATC